MKKIFLAIAAIAILYGCAALKPTEREVYTYVADYRAYSEAGFLITPQPYHGEYESLGEVDIHIIPAFKEAGEEYGYMGEIWQTYKFEKISMDTIVDTAVKQAVEIGADAIANFSITGKVIERVGSRKTYEGIEYRVKGFCIKRK